MKMPEKRKLEILELIKLEKMVSIKKLSESFDASYLTIRRDLEKLENEGLIHKVYGGAVLKKKLEPEPFFEELIIKNVNEKDRIALEAVNRIKDNDSIVIESGSTGFEMVKYLNNKKNIKVTTAGIPIFIELYKLAQNKDDIEINACGGMARIKIGTFIGRHANHYFNEINVDKAFIGVQAVSIEKGLSTSTEVDADIKRAIIDCANTIILICDSSKFGTYSYFNVSSLDQIDEIITDNSLSIDFIDKIKRKGIKLTLV
jgi:DeoR/GlpR family transcriptional regulator of sugar metabolism